jgi:hypothetical protein
MAAINPTIRDRIIASAEEIYNAGGRKKLPTVGVVRRHSNTSMSDTCEVMQEWRRLQTTPASAPIVQIPDRVLQASPALIISIWNANESLDLAQASWDKARAEILEIREEANADFELERTDNEGLRAQLVAAEAQATADILSASKLLSEERERSALLKDQAQIALARTVEIEKRADDLKAALSDSQRDLQEARTVAAMAREHQAILEGKCQALEGQQALFYAGTVRGKRATSKQTKNIEREKVRTDCQTTPSSK